MTYTTLQKFQAENELIAHKEMLATLEQKYPNDYRAINYTVNQIQRLILIIGCPVS